MNSKFLHRLLLKTAKLSSQSSGTSGFTLLELLVSAIMAIIMVTTLITFATSILETDRKEQAKVATQEELQSALNYIADDMQEAIYVYDAAGINAITTGTNSTYKLPTGTDTTTGRIRTPVLAFWKRALLDRNSQVTLATGGSILVRCLGVTASNPTTPAPEGNCLGTDQFVYSLVAYYLVKDSTPSTIWSKAARIERWEVRDGIVNPTCPSNAPTCANGAKRDDGYQSVDTNYYYVKPDTGFVRFDLSAQATSLSGKMNLWKTNASANINFDPYASRAQALVDFIDDTAYATNQDNGSGSGILQIPIRSNATALNATTNANLDCESNAADSKGSTGLGSVRVPADFGNATNNPTGLTSFYACVNSRLDRPIARVFIRGNALVRLFDNTALRQIGDANNSTFIPTSNALVFGRSVIVP
jgi:type II secretory pathway pseudopilin PulG